VREVIGARIGRLGGEAKRTLAVAAVIGRDFDLDVLSRATGTTEDDLLDILDSAASASLVREQSDRPGRFSFAHVLIQRAVLYDLGPTRTARTHRQVAEALEAVCGDRPGPRIGALARHWFEAQPLDVARAISYAHRAGDAALAGLAPEVALRFYVQAITLMTDHGVADEMLSIDLAIGLGTAQRQTGDPACRETLLDAARRAAAIDDTDRLVVAALANDRGWYSVSGAVDEDKVALLELALDRLPADHQHRALVLGTLCAELAFSGTLERRQALADQALSIALTTGDDATVARILNHLVFPLLVPSLLDQSLAWSDEALRRAQRVGDPVLIYFAAMYRATVATRAGDMAEVDRCLAIAGPLTQQLDQPSLHWEYTFHLARRAQVAGDTAEAERLATRALEIGTECGQPDAATFFGAQLAVVSWQRGTMGDLAPLLEQMVVANPGLASLQASLAVAYAEGDRLDEARRLLESFAASGFELPQDSTWLNGMTEYAEAAIACGDPSFAAPLLDRLAPFEQQFSCAGGVTAEGPVSLVLGGLATVLGLTDDADRYFAEAAAFSERVEATYFAARTDLLWGQMLARRGADGDLTAAGVLLDRARSVSATQGYAGLERRAVACLAAMDGPAVGRTSGSPDRRNGDATDQVGTAGPSER
jgi:tetratricopeptide (TPR) repeat protein